MRTLDRDAQVQQHRAPLANRAVVRLLGSRMRHLAGGKLVALRYTARSGRSVVMPVQAARHGDVIVVLSGNAATKRWWRHFLRAAPVAVLVDGEWQAATGRVATGAGSDAAAAYRQTFPRVTLAPDATFVVVTLDAPSSARPLLSGGALVRRWFWTVTVAEFVGFAVPAVVGALTATAVPAVSLPAVLAAGAVEGGMLGWGQVNVLRRALPGMRRRPWIVATAAAAMLAYAIGLAPSTFAGSIESWPMVALVPGAAVLGGALLATIGTAQWSILRHHVRQAGRWIATTALAWLVGLAVFLGFSMPLWQPGQPLALVVGIGIVGGLLMAATTSLISGTALRWLLR